MWAKRMSCKQCDKPAPPHVVSAAHKRAAVLAGAGGPGDGRTWPKPRVPCPTVSVKARRQQELSASALQKVLARLEKVEGVVANKAKPQGDTSDANAKPHDASEQQAKAKGAEQLAALMPMRGKGLWPGGDEALEAKIAEIQKEQKDSEAVQPVSMREANSKLFQCNRKHSQLQQRLKEKQQRMLTLQADCAKLEADIAECEVETAAANKQLEIAKR